jgi:GT2 family glycosyltransferase
VNWNSGRRLQKCLETLSGATKVVIVDNASTDGSIDGLATDQLPVEMISNSANRGFAAGCNQGAAQGTAPYILFLNPDTALSSTALSTALNFMDSDEGRRVAICGLRLVDAEGNTLPSCARFPTAWHMVGRSVGLDRVAPRLVPPHMMLDWSYNERRDVDQVQGAFFLIRRAVFEELKGFDERFFMYFEELELSLRVRRAGWRSTFLPDATVFHEERASSNLVLSSRLFYAIRSRVLYAFMHFAWWQATAVMLAALSVEAMARLCFSLVKGSWRDFESTIGAYTRVWIALPDILRAARQALASR